MKNTIKKLLIGISTFALVCGASVGGALAYFTATDTAKGGITLNIKPGTSIEETAEGANKLIFITNTGDGDATTEDATVYVRVWVSYGGDQTVNVGGTNWSKGSDGYYYYSQPLAPGASTETLKAEVSVENEELNHEFSIVVAQECCAVNFEGANGPDYQGWLLTAKTE